MVARRRTSFTGQPRGTYVASCGPDVHTFPPDSLPRQETRGDTHVCCHTVRERGRPDRGARRARRPAARPCRPPRRPVVRHPHRHHPDGGRRPVRAVGPGPAGGPALPAAVPIAAAAREGPPATVATRTRPAGARRGATSRPRHAEPQLLVGEAAAADLAGAHVGG